MPTCDLIEYLDAQRTWSMETFGPGLRTKGIIAHIRKELEEIENEPLDLEEFIDVAILAFDGAWRAGHSSGQIAEALMAKLKKNKDRQWPDWRNYGQDQPIEHKREVG